MSAKIFEFVATIQCSAVIAAPDEATARQCVETWERAWFETGEIVGVVDVDLTDVRPAPRTKEAQEDVAHIVLTKRSGKSEKPCALEAERDALRERCVKLEWLREVEAWRPPATHHNNGNGSGKRWFNSCQEYSATLQAALAATEVEPSNYEWETAAEVKP